MDAVQALRKTVARLRGPGGCPWDREQTHQTLAQCLIEETAELLEAIDEEDFEWMREELGDVLLQVVFHAQLNEEAGRFGLEAVADEVNAKLIRRHPHVFGGEPLETTGEVLKQWDAIKAREKQSSRRKEGDGSLEMPPRQLPALLFAREAFKRLGKAGCALPEGVDAAALNERAEAMTEESAGRELFELAATCRLAGIDPESALRRYAAAALRTTRSG